VERNEISRRRTEMKKLTFLATGFAALVLSAAATAADAPKLPYGQSVPGPTNPWPAKNVKVAFFVETVTASKNESVWGAWANTACTRTNFFPRKERIVWHITAVDTKTGDVIEAEDVKYAYLKIPGLPNLKLKYGPHGRDPATAPWNWYYGWDVPPDYPLGLVDYQIVVKTKSMKRAGEVATFKEFPLASEQLTIVNQRTPLS
jgi:hypothetical protein